MFLLGITVFKNVVFMYPRVRDRFRDLVLEAISRERNGEVVDHTLLNGAAQMLVDMEDGKLGLYEQEFEREFLKMSEQYFHGLALKFLSMTVPEFLRKVEETLADEEMRLGTYLAETTRPKLMKLFNLEMLEVHAKAVIEVSHPCLFRFAWGLRLSHCVCFCIARWNAPASMTWWIQISCKVGMYLLLCVHHQCP